MKNFNHEPTRTTRTFTPKA